MAIEIVEVMITTIDHETGHRYVQRHVMVPEEGYLIPEAPIAFRMTAPPPPALIMRLMVGSVGVDISVRPSAAMSDVVTDLPKGRLIVLDDPTEPRLD